jgi:dihydroorotate dehydrogenase electron transfer subunit
MISQFSSSVLSKENLQERIFKLTLSSPFISKTSEPGNFIHIRVDSIDSPLLRRPFSIHNVEKDKEAFEILLKVVGHGTNILSKKSPGDTLDILGPIGNSFSLPEQGKDIMLVAGGMGIAPLWFLFNRLIRRSRKNKLTFFLGAKSEEELVYVEKINKLGGRLILTTDDGSVGRKGMVTDIFLQKIKKKSYDHKKLTVFSCGPGVMLKRMSEIAKRLDLSCQVSLETHMACGVGACWGCVVKQIDGNYKRVCVDGPVFDAREIILD